MKHIIILLVFIFPSLIFSQEGIIFKEIKFFEAGYESPKENVTYSTDFSKEKTRYIWTRVFLKNLLYKKSDQSHTVLFKYYDYYDSLIAEFTTTINIKKELEEPYTSRGWGWQEPGNWKEGIYLVEVYIDDNFVGDKQFLIIEEKYLQEVDKTIQITGMKFWESPMDNPLPPDKRIYSDNFFQNETRVIYTTLEVKNLLYKKDDNNVNLYLKYYTPDGYLWGVPKISVTLNKDWEHADIYNGYGFDEEGNFTPGVYKVEAYYQGKLITYDYFEIILIDK